MECNKDEAKRAMDIAEKKLSENDYVGAKKFLTKAHNLYPHLDGLSQVSTMIHVYISAAENKINGGKESDLYGVLGVDPLADDEAIKKQFKKLALLLHPDKNSCKGAEGAFKLVLNAWSLLSDKAKRSAYDLRRKLSNGMQRPHAPSQHNKPPGSSNVYQNGRYGVDPNGKARSNHPNASGPQRPPPTYAPKPGSFNVNQNARCGVDPTQRPPTYAPKTASSSANQNASRDGVHPSANTRSNQPASGPHRPPPYAPKPASSSNHPASGPRKPPASSSANQSASNHPASGPHKPSNPHKPASSSASQSASDGVYPSANSRSNKAAPGPGPGPGPVPAPRSKQMFWAVCNGCKTRSECRRDLYLNKTMRCQNCGQTYIATEKNPWDHYVNKLNKALSILRQRQQQWSSAQSQATSKNTNGASSSSSSSSPFVGATKKHSSWESYVNQINYSLSLVVMLQARWNAQTQASNSNTNVGSTSSAYVGAVPEVKFALQQVFSTFSSLLQLQQQWTPSVSPHASVVSPSNLSSSSPQQQQQWGSQNTSGATYYPSARGSSPSVSATGKGPHASVVSPGVVSHSSSPQQQQLGGTNYPSSSGSFHQNCSPYNSGNDANQAQERSKRGLEDSQDTLAAIEMFFKKLGRDVV